MKRICDILVTFSNHFRDLDKLPIFRIVPSKLPGHLPTIIAPNRYIVFSECKGCILDLKKEGSLCKHGFAALLRQCCWQCFPSMQLPDITPGGCRTAIMSGMVLHWHSPPPCTSPQNLNQNKLRLPFPAPLQPKNSIHYVYSALFQLRPFRYKPLQLHPLSPAVSHSALSCTWMVSWSWDLETSPVPTALAVRQKMPAFKRAIWFTPSTLFLSTAAKRYRLPFAMLAANRSQLPFNEREKNRHWRCIPSIPPLTNSMKQGYGYGTALLALAHLRSMSRKAVHLADWGIPSATRTPEHVSPSQRAKPALFRFKAFKRAVPESRECCRDNF